MNIFKEYDVRGVYPEEVDEEVAERLGKAFAEYLQGSTVLAGRDGRKSSPSLYEALIKGLKSQGVKVKKAGLITTPMLYYSAYTTSFDGYVTVTASHNPKEYNGFKLCKKGPLIISMGEGLERVEELFLKNNFSERGGGSEEEAGLLRGYVERVKSFCKEEVSGLKVLVDASNGAGAIVMKALLEELNVQHRLLNEEVDGDFPGHPPNPLLEESQKSVKEELRRGGYDLGVLLDADADRALFFDELGNPLKSSTVALLLAQHYHRGGPVVLDALNYRKSVVEEFNKLGVKVIPSKVGFTNIHKAMLESKALLSAEYSCHYSHWETACTDDTALAWVKMLSCLARTGKKLSELARPYEEQVVIQENLEVEGKEEAVKRVDAAFQDCEETLYLDGVSKTFKDYWFNVRPSNTEPVLRVTVEAATREEAFKVLGRVKEVVLNAKRG